MIIRMMYVLPMIIGRTYDIEKKAVGVDIFPDEDVRNPRIIEETFYTSSFRTIETSSDVKEFLSVKGDLSLGIKAGMFTFRGMGSYVKDSINSHNSVDVLTKVSYRTVSRSLPYSAKPVPYWKKMGKEYLGTHYVQSVLYGGDLIACIRFKASKAEYLQDIRVTIKTSLEGGSALDLVGEGKLETLDKKLESKATMEINYFANVPLEGIPNTITGLRDLVRNFEQHVKKVNDGWGVPVEVELSDLSMFDRGFLHIKNSALEAELEFFEEYFDDLLVTKSRLNSWMRTLPDELNPADEKMIADFISRLSKILRTFIETISQLNSEKGPEQLNGAKNAYKEGKGLGMAGKFRKELNKLMKKIVVPKTLLDDPSFSIYIHYGSSDCATIESASTLYPGYLTSSVRNSTGNGYNHLCLPKSPDENALKTYTGAKNQSFLAGVKYGFMENKPFPFDDEDIMLRGVVCAACLMNQTQTVFTFHGQNECPDQEGWRVIYEGYLMAPTDVSRGETICVDKKLESHTDSYMGFYDQSLNFVLRKQEGELLFVPCVVCAK